MQYSPHIERKDNAVQHSSSKLPVGMSGAAGGKGRAWDRVQRGKGGGVEGVGDRGVYLKRLSIRVSSGGSACSLAAGEGLLVHCELDGISCCPGSQVVHACLQPSLSRSLLKLDTGEG